jgi:hypothetical protein
MGGVMLRRALLAVEWCSLAPAFGGGCPVNRRRVVGTWLHASLCCRGSTRSSPLRGQRQALGRVVATRALILIPQRWPAGRHGMLSRKAVGAAPGGAKVGPDSKAAFQEIPEPG